MLEKKVISKIFAGASSLALALTLVACGGAQGGGAAPADAGPTSAAELLKEYQKKAPDSYTTSGSMDMMVEAEASGMTMKAPITIGLDVDAAGKYQHGTMTMAMTMAGQSQKMNMEYYSDASSGKIVLYSRQEQDGKQSDWDVSESGEITPGDIDPMSSISKDVFKKAKFKKTSSGYKVTIDLKTFMKDNAALNQMLDSMTSSAGVDLESAFDKGTVVYSFDKDCNLVGVKMSEFTVDMEGTSGGTKIKYNITMGMNFKYTNQGKIKEADVKVPADVVSAANGGAAA